MMNTMRNKCIGFTFFLLLSSTAKAEVDKTVRVFIFAGQSNMVGSDSNVKDIKRFPPFAGLENAQTGVKFSYCIGREKKMKSDGWVALQPVNNIVGPELSFARKVSQHVEAPIAIIKCAAGGTHLGGDNRVNAIDVTTAVGKIAAADGNLIHVKAFDLPKQEKKLVMDTAGIIRLGELAAEAYLKQQ